MTFTAATAEQRFVLDHIVGIGALAENDRFAAATSDVVDAVLDGAGDFAAGEWAPLLRAGDTVGAKWTPDGVVMPEAYRRRGLSASRSQSPSRLTLNAIRTRPTPGNTVIHHSPA